MKEKRHTCPFESCGKCYSTSWNLNQHIARFHYDLKQFHCVHCGKSFASKQNLCQHSNIHTGKRPFRCQEPGCTETFRYGSQLWQHKRLHAVMRPASPLKAAIMHLTSALLPSSEFTLEEQTSEVPASLVKSWGQLTATLGDLNNFA